MLTRLGGHADARAKVAAAMLLTLRGTPIVYYGEEIGMPASKVPRKGSGRSARQEVLAAAGVPGSVRAPDAVDSGGTPVSPRCALASRRPLACPRASKREQGDEDSLLNWYRRLMSLRSGSAALRTGSYRSLDAVPRGVFAYLREAGGQQVLVALNFASRPREIAFRRPATPTFPPSRSRGRCSSRRAGPTAKVLGREGVVDRERGRVTLAAYEALVLDARR